MNVHIQEKLMENRLSPEKMIHGQTKPQMVTSSAKEYVWKNIFKVEALKKENSLRKSQTLCKNLQIKYK